MLVLNFTHPLTEEQGRKYYFHHNPDKEPHQENRLIMFGRTQANRYIQHIDRDTQFHCQLEFNNLEEDEFAMLMLAATLEDTRIAETWNA